MSEGYPKFRRLTEAQRRRFEALKCPDPNGPDHGEGEVLYYVKGHACTVADGSTRITLGGAEPNDAVIFPTFRIPALTPDVHARTVDVWHVCGTGQVRQVLATGENELGRTVLVPDPPRGS